MPCEPAEFPPPVKPAEEFVTGITDPEEERIEVGVAIVGGGPAGLACAIRLMQLLEDEPELTEKLGEVGIEGDRVGEGGSRTAVLELKPPPAKEAGEIIEDEDTNETVEKIVAWLDERKLI